jgi:hypothetical protein
MKASSGTYATGLVIIACVELVAVLLVFAFIAKEPRTAREASPEPSRSLA